MKLAALWLAVPLLVGAAGACAAGPAASGFHARFTETRSLPGFDTPLMTHGQVQFDAAGFRWEVTAPYHYLFEMHGDQAQEQMPDGRVRKLEAAQTPWLLAVRQLLASALSGDPAQLGKYFNAKTTLLAKGRRVLLTPKPGVLAKAIRQIEVTESAPGHPEQLLIQETAGGRLDIRFTPVTP